MTVNGAAHSGDRILMWRLRGGYTLVRSTFSFGPKLDAEY
jgi:hypothetical protein